MTRAIIFDFDGVIVDSVDIKTRAFARLFAEHGPDVTRRVVEHHLSNGGISRFQKFRHIYKNILSKTMPEGELECLGNRFSELVFDEVARAPWIPGAPEFLRHYHSQFMCFVASGTPEDELRRIVEIRGLSSYFAGIFGSPTTKEEIARRILAAHSLARQDVVFVGDAMTDYDAAMACGLRFIGIGAASSGGFPLGTTVLPNLRELATML